MKKKRVILLLVAVFAVFILFKIFGSSEPSDSPASGGRTPSAQAPDSPDADSDADDDADSSRGDDSRNSGAGFGATKQVEIVDPFFNNAVAYTLTIPEDWVFEGTVLHGPGCMVDYTSVVYRAYSPDMQFGVQVAPTQTWYWADNPSARPTGQVCKYLPAISAANYAAFFAARMRPDAQLDGAEQSPDVDDFFARIEENNQKGLAQAQATNAQPSMHDSGDAARLRIHYDWEGRSEEEWLDVRVLNRDIARFMMVYPEGGGPGRVGRSQFQILTVALTGYRAPKGKLDRYGAALAAIAKSLAQDPDYKAAADGHVWDQLRRQAAASAQITHTIVQASEEQMRINAENAQAQIANIQRQGQEFRDNMEREGEIRHQNVMAQIDAQTAHARDVQDYLLDQQYYVNPDTGETATLGGRYNHAYANGPASSNSTAYLQTDGAYNPNGILGFNWTELQPIHH
ncbi:MAG TPA: hypothetical protein VLY23_15465 [Candidatus Acidoferrum sp.]|nr:hypothetical protein [Candidatus Acidoferrum sp.]